MISSDLGDGSCFSLTQPGKKETVLGKPLKCSENCRSHVHVLSVRFSSLRDPLRTSRTCLETERTGKPLSHCVLQPVILSLSLLVD